MKRIRGEAEDSGRHQRTCKKPPSASAKHGGGQNENRDEEDPYDESIHGPIPYNKLDFEIRALLDSIESGMLRLSERAGEPASDAVPSDEEIESYYRRVNNLAKQDVEELKVQVKKHPHLTKALTKERRCLLEIICCEYIFASYIDALGTAHHPNLNASRDEALLFLVQENPFSLLYPFTLDDDAEPLEEGEEEKCMWSDLSELRILGPSYFIYENPSLWWMFEHPLALHRENRPPAFGLFLDSMKQNQYDLAKRVVTAASPGATLLRDKYGNTLLQYFSMEVECFNKDIFEWLVQQTPDGLKDRDGSGSGVLHSLCFALVRTQTTAAREQAEADLARRRAVVCLIKEIVDRSPDLAMMKCLAGETPFMKLCWYLRGMYRDAHSLQDSSMEGFHEACMGHVIDVAQYMVQRIPGLAKEENASHENPLDDLCEICNHRQVQDLAESICRAAYPHIEYSRNSRFYSSLEIELMIEAARSKRIVQLKRAQMVLQKNDHLSSSKVSGESVEAYCKWATSRIQELSAGIKTIRNIEIPNLKDRFTGPEELDDLSFASSAFEDDVSLASSAVDEESSDEDN